MPSIILPLHIFEERYKLMIGECLEHKKAFGVVHQRGSKIKKIGCTARILQVLRRFDDGRLDIITQGVNRFLIESVYEDKAYLQAEVTYFDDETQERTHDTKMLISAGIKLLEKLDAMTGKKGEYTQLSQLDHKTISFVISHSDGFTLEEKQRFLEMTSTNQRITQSVISLKTLVEKEVYLQGVKKVIGGNGDPRRGD
jgi:Lon protease-like protein